MPEKKLEREFVMLEYSYDEYYPTHKLTKDGEPIVRCSRCKHWCPNPLHHAVGKCSNGNSGTWYFDDFCSNGDPK